MDRKMYEMLQKDLKQAISEKNMQKAFQIADILNISQEQRKYFAQGLTGYPSVDQVWLKNFKDNAYEEATILPEGKTVWDVIEEKLIEFYDIPAIEYFKKEISRPEFIENVDRWARTFRAMGVEPNEVVPIYGPFFPDIIAMVFALNAIGATSYFLKLAITKEQLIEETENTKVAVVFDGMWNNVSDVFSDARFKKVLVATATDSMPSPKKEIVSFLSYMQAKKNKSLIPNDKKYVWLDDAKKIADYYTGQIKVPFEKDRAAFITSSSGTSIGGAIKSPVATNESTIAQLYMGKASQAQYHPGDRVLTNFPPTAATSLNCFCLMALFNGSTIVNDPRVSATDFYNQLTKAHVNCVISTGSMWEEFFNRIEFEMSLGKKFDFSCATAWCIGGEGTDKNQLDRWNIIMDICGAPHHLMTGYGSSELFSIITADYINNLSNENNTKNVTAVGVPYAGMALGIFDENGNELSYNERGEIRIKSKSAMKEYYNKPELTSQIRDGEWIVQGDIGEVDENGFVYVYGRAKDKINTSNGELYLFDISAYIKSLPYVHDAMVFAINLDSSNNVTNLKVHIAFDKKIDDLDKNDMLKVIDQKLLEFLPSDVKVVAYKEHYEMLPYSPTTLKKDRNLMYNTRDGYKAIDNGEIVNVSFSVMENGRDGIIYHLMQENHEYKSSYR